MPLLWISCCNIAIMNIAWRTTDWQSIKCPTPSKVMCPTKQSEQWLSKTVSWISSVVAFAHCNIYCFPETGSQTDKHCSVPIAVSQRHYTFDWPVLLFWQAFDRTWMSECSNFHIAPFLGTAKLQGAITIPFPLAISPVKFQSTTKEPDNESPWRIGKTKQMCFELLFEEGGWNLGLQWQSKGVS